MAANDDKAAKTPKYKVLDRLWRDHKEYGPGIKGGETIELADQAEADALIAAGVLEAPQGKAAAATA